MFKVNHWFDSLAVVHRFQILPPDEEHPTTRVVYNSRSTCDKLIEYIQKTGDRGSMTFGAKYDPCNSFFKKIKSVFKPTYPAGEMSADARSMSVTLSVNFPGLDEKGQSREAAHPPGIHSLCNKSDMSELQMIHPETLEPLGMASQKVLHPDLTGPFSAAHARTDPVTGDVFNYNLDVKFKGKNYRVFRVSAATGETTILATFPGDAAYIHSFFLTENYVILVIWNSFFAAGGAKILWHRNVIDTIGHYDDTRPARWYVIDRRHGKGLIATYQSDPFFSFHTVNAYEEPSTDGSGTDIVGDIVAYNNLDCLKRFYIDNIISTSESAANMTAEPTYELTLRRYRLPLIPDKPTTDRRKAELVFSTKTLCTLELPTLNPHYVTRRHRYVYGIAFTGKSSFVDAVVKFDTQTQTPTFWNDHGQCAGEPIFVPRPRNAEDGREPDEDDGVLLTVVLDGLEGRSYLLVLDAKSMMEIARADVHGAIGFGLHGVHVSSVDKGPTMHR